MEKKIKVIIADDHDIYLDGLERSLNETGSIEVVGLATNGKILVELVRQHEADIVLTDLQMPVMDGIAAIGAIRHLQKNIKSIVLSNFDDKYYVVDALKAGAMGYVLKGAHKSEIIEAIKTVYENTNYYYCGQVKKVMTEIIRYSNFSLSSPVDVELFTKLERKIIHYICEEKTSKEIGVILFMGRRSVEQHRSIILEKMNVKQVTGLIKFAMKHNLYPAPHSILEDRQ